MQQKSSTLRRFALGFLASATVSFIVALLYSSRFTEGLVGASVAGVGFGTIAGILSAFGERMYKCVWEFTRAIILNP